MILSLTHNILGIYRIKVGLKTHCIERNRIVQIQRNNYSWLYFVIKGVLHVPSTKNWHVFKLQIKTAKMLVLDQ